MKGEKGNELGIYREKFKLGSVDEKISPVWRREEEEHVRPFLCYYIIISCNITHTKLLHACMIFACFFQFDNDTRKTC